METERRDAKVKHYFGCSSRFPASSAPYNMVLHLFHLEGPGLSFLSFIHFFFPECITSACALPKFWRQASIKNKIKFLLQARCNHYQICNLYQILSLLSSFVYVFICFILLKMADFTLDHTGFDLNRAGNGGGCYWCSSPAYSCQFHLLE